MMQRLLTWACWATLTWLPAYAQTFAISGTVVDHRTNRPLSGVNVTIVPVHESATPIAFRSADDGHFVFTNLAPGKYRLSAKKNGYPSQSFQGHEQYSTAIAVGAGLQSEGIVFPLTAGGVISGRVTDDANEAVRQAQVSLFRKQIVAGVEEIRMRATKQTNSSGEYRFPELSPGSYFVVVAANPWYAQNQSLQNQPGQSEAGGSELTNRELDVTYPLVYSGNVTDSASATAISVTEGNTSEVDFALRAIPALHIEVTGLPVPKPGVGVGLSVLPVAFGRAEPGLVRSGFGSGEGKTEIFGLPPGRYLVSPYSHGSGEANRSAELVDFSTDQTLDISSLKRGSVTGQLRFEGTPAPRHPELILHQVDSQFADRLTIADDGHFKLAENVFPLSGRCELTLRSVAGFYLKSVEAKGTTLSGRQFDCPLGNSLEFSLVAAPGASKIDGIALTGDQSMGGAMVLLLPKDPGRSNFVRRDQSDSDGTFTLPEVAPGRYTLVAIDDGQELPYMDPSAMQPYLSGGTEITAPLENGAPVKVQIAERIR